MEVGLMSSRETIREYRSSTDFSQSKLSCSAPGPLLQMDKLWPFHATFGVFNKQITVQISFKKSVLVHHIKAWWSDIKNDQVQGLH